MTTSEGGSLWTLSGLNHNICPQTMKTPQSPQFVISGAATCWFLDSICWCLLLLLQEKPKAAQIRKRE